jgi:hypothetical protein
MHFSMDLQRANNFSGLRAALAASERVLYIVELLDVVRSGGLLVRVDVPN